MRTMLAAAALLMAASALDRASAVEYPWCALYGETNGGINCGFVSLEQCRLAISGNGGVCAPNGFYNARAAESPRKPRRSQR